MSTSLASTASTSRDVEPLTVILILASLIVAVFFALTPAITEEKAGCIRRGGQIMSQEEQTDIIVKVIDKANTYIQGVYVTVIGLLKVAM